MRKLKNLLSDPLKAYFQRMSYEKLTEINASENKESVLVRLIDYRTITLFSNQSETRKKLKEQIELKKPRVAVDRHSHCFNLVKDLFFNVEKNKWEQLNKNCDQIIEFFQQNNTPELITQLLVELSEKRTAGFWADENALYLLMVALSRAAQENNPQVASSICEVINALLKKCNTPEQITQLLAGLSEKSTAGAFSGENALFRVMCALSWTVEKNQENEAILAVISALIDKFFRLLKISDKCVFENLTQFLERLLNSNSRVGKKEDLLKQTINLLQDNAAAYSFEQKTEIQALFEKYNRADFAWECVVKTVVIKSKPAQLSQNTPILLCDAQKPLSSTIATTTHRQIENLTPRIDEFDALDQWVVQTFKSRSIVGKKSEPLVAKTPHPLDSFFQAESQLTVIPTAVKEVQQVLRVERDEIRNSLKEEKKICSVFDAGLFATHRVASSDSLQALLASVTLPESDLPAIQQTENREKASISSPT